MQFGRSYEEFEVGATYKHWPGKTVTEYDDHLFCLLTMNHHPLHLDEHYAQETTEFGRNVVVGNYVYSILLGMSVPDISGKAIANLEIESLRHVAPTFHGDTLYGETRVLEGQLPQGARWRAARSSGAAGGQELAGGAGVKAPQVHHGMPTNLRFPRCARHGMRGLLCIPW
jgi:acyl dehydratase